MTEVLIRTEVAVVGAGPAGLSAAVTAAEAGLQVALIDAASQPGGQYWRHPDQAHPVADEGCRTPRLGRLHRAARAAGTAR